jgi:hypothetical protein
MSEVSPNRQDTAGPKAYASISGQHIFEMLTDLFPPRSIGPGMLKCRDPFEEPLMDHGYSLDPLDLLILVESSRLGREVLIKGAATSNIVKAHGHFSRRISRIHNESRRFRTCSRWQPLSITPRAMAVADGKLCVRGVGGAQSGRRFDHAKGTWRTLRFPLRCSTLLEGFRLAPSVV